MNVFDCAHLYSLFICYSHWFMRIFIASSTVDINVNKCTHYTHLKLHEFASFVCALTHTYIDIVNTWMNAFLPLCKHILFYARYLMNTPCLECSLHQRQHNWSTPIMTGLCTLLLSVSNYAQGAVAQQSDKKLVCFKRRSARMSVSVVWVCMWVCSECVCVRVCVCVNNSITTPNTRE